VGVTETYVQFAVNARNPTLIDPGIADGWDSQHDVTENSERLNAAADIGTEHGFESGYHNNRREFGHLDDTSRAYDIIENVTDSLHLQFDVGWVFIRVGRPDPLTSIVDHGNEINALHLRNWTEPSREFTEIYEGDLNQRAAATAARNVSDVEHLMDPHDYPPHPEDSFEHARTWHNKLNSPWEPGGIPGISASDVHLAKLE
jgi:sugar phosphate isomerase/epimerase